uniref:Uncharacterized protein n=1 Tax=Populus trichocarpa TaxID=3694 RepID=A0A2K1XEP7_POPTR
MDASLIQQPLTLPTGDMEIDNQLSVHHLVKAYKEAMENKEAELAEVITRRISKKVGPTGEIEEHLLYYSFQPLDKETDYFTQESAKNFDGALEAFYKIFPDGMISHFTANSVILEAKPRDAEALHIIDFDMGEGMQWSSIIMALGRKQKELQAQQYYGHIPHYMTLKLTAIKWKDEGSGHDVPSWRKFEETKRRLHDCTNPFGLILEVEEVELQDLARKMKGKRKGGERREWLAFNFMWALSQLARKRSRRHVLDFVRTAKEILASISVYSNTSNRGFWLEGLRLSNESLLEAKEMVREGEAPYAVRIEGENYNEMVLEFRGTQLIKFSARKL